MAVVIAAEVGWLASWFVFDKQFHQPLRKILKSAMDGWESSMTGQIELMSKLYNLDVPKVEEDGSMKSPIQIKKEE